MILRAYAKINLGLRILRKRADGYHDIETVFHRIQPCDELTLAPSDVISLVTNKHDLPTDEGNLCIRAASLLQQQFSTNKGVHISLKKFIPVGAGLGGGSSDAATILIGVAKFWNITITKEELHILALKLGSDVPYFLEPGTAYAIGRGEQLTYFNCDLPYWIVLVYPNIHISTAWAYRETRVSSSHNLESSQLIQSPRDILLEHIQSPDKLRRMLRNDFESLIVNTYPLIAEIKQGLYDTGAVFAQMSGSGSAIFGFFTEESSAREAIQTFGNEYSVFLTPPHFNEH